MNKIRIIPRIDLKNNDVVKGYHLEGWKKIGDQSNSHTTTIKISVMK